MADWRVELETLLSHLHVSLEQEAVPARKEAAAGRSRTEEGAHDDQEQAAMLEPDIPHGDEASPDGDEVSAVRSEIEATVRRVVALTQAGMLDTQLRDDVVFVLQALTRPQPRTGKQRARSHSPADSSSEWQLASAAAVLHFCRIVLHLTQAVSPNTEE